MEIGYQVGQTVIMENSRQNAEQDRDNQQPVFCLMRTSFSWGFSCNTECNAAFSSAKSAREDIINFRPQQCITVALLILHRINKLSGRGPESGQTPEIKRGI
ncbi:hypothetical protein CIT292_07466 [Citrobacter youngae ATCC 29220]|uniref:Uncharacterized protein n=1 Tax=Citrobacter youngae ATCC 29220 TaxID=500640 RepID=D4BAH2_9ENTR|nr:hypothetical protein CIT292_07466 [Citrobacter youngae ATCC 29220]